MCTSIFLFLLTLAGMLNSNSRKKNKKQACLTDSIKYMYDRSYKTRHIERVWLGSYTAFDCICSVFLHSFLHLCSTKSQLDN